MKATSPIIGNSLDTVFSICAATDTNDEDKISCAIYLVEKHHGKYGDAKWKFGMIHKLPDSWKERYFINCKYFYKCTYSKEKCMYI